MIKVRELLATSPYNETYWTNLILSGATKSHFLMLVIPFMAHIYQEFAHSKIFSKKNVSHLLYKYIYKIFSHNVSEMIDRVCVFEMRVASQTHVLKGRTAEERFSYFIELLSQPAVRLDILNKYPALAEALSIYTTQTIHELKELFNRLEQDKDTLLKHFLKNNPLFRLQSITESGDKHQGKSVLILTFSYKAEKIKFVYKPRSLKIAIAFQNLVYWLNKHSKKCKLYELKIIDRKEYGWIEFIDHRSCKTIADIEAFYYRQGILLMLSYLLRAYDLHYENIIAHGAYPVIVDYECFCGPDFSLNNNDQTSSYRHLVSSMAFLPGKELDEPGGENSDFSAIAGKGGVSSRFKIRWVNRGKDTMFAKRSTFKRPNAANKPLFKDKSPDYLKFQPQFEQGFIDAYHVILKYKKQLLENHGVLSQFKNAHVRVVLRDTSLYGEILYESWHPTLLYTKRDYVNHLYTLNRVMTALPVYKNLIRSELNDLKQNNIPYFYCSTSSKIIRNSVSNAVNIPVLETGYQYIKNSLTSSISHDDLNIQLMQIKNSYRAEQLNGQQAKKYLKNIKLSVGSVLSINEIQEKSLHIAKREFNTLIKYHIISDDEIFWPLLECNDKNQWESTFTNIHLYDGIAGIALSFAYGAKVFRDSHYLKMAKLCLTTLRKKFSTFGIKSINTLGAFEGLGGLIYLYSKLHHLWHDEQIKQDMLMLINYIPSLLKKSTAVDVVSGSAGLLVVLTSLCNFISINYLIPLMRLCVNHILKHNTYTGKKTYYQINSIKMPLLGMAHGQFGITFALQRYAALEPNANIKTRILAELNRINAYFNRHVPEGFQNVSTHLLSTTLPNRTSWCHGAGGIWLAQIALLNSNSNHDALPQLSSELQVLIKSPNPYSCLCHGYLGKIEVLLAAYRYINSKSTQNSIEKYMSAVVVDLERNANNYDSSYTFSPGLMTGSAGVALTMLRIANHYPVPSILLLE